MRLTTILTICAILAAGYCEILPEPMFSAPITNVTAPVGREAVLACTVHDLSTYKVAWLRVDTQTILTIHSHVLTKNKRISVSHSDHHTWYLHIREVRETDRGWYMCQINTDPMKSQVGYLDIVVPPDILDQGTSSDLVAREGSSVSLKCNAVGAPLPQITWRREGGEPLRLGEGIEAMTVDGPVLNLSKVTRMDMGAYLCIASNGVPPSVSKRIMLIVHFPPVIWIQNQLVGAVEGQSLSLECHSEAYPKSINYWTREKGEILSQGGEYAYEPQLMDNVYKVHMRLLIKSVRPQDFGTYKCVSKNSLGDTDGNVKVYQLTRPTSVTAINTGKKTKDKNRKTANDIIKVAGRNLESQEVKPRRSKTFDGDLDDIDYEDDTDSSTNLSLHFWLFLSVVTIQTVAILLVT